MICIDSTILVKGNEEWSLAQEVSVRVCTLEMKYSSGNNWGSFDVTFTNDTWDVSTMGLIYGDSRFLRGLKNRLIDLGFSLDAVEDLTYSEVGLQSDNSVNLDGGSKFLQEFRDISTSYFISRRYRVEEILPEEIFSTKSGSKTRQKIQ